MTQVSMDMDIINLLINTYILFLRHLHKIRLYINEYLIRTTFLRFHYLTANSQVFPCPNQTTNSTDIHN